MSSIKPHILFVTGAWHDTAYLGATCNKLIEKGYPVICPLLPSFAAAPHVSMHDDAAHIRTLIDGCIRQGGEILVVAHSYGGVVATQAILPNHSRRARSIAGLPGGVVRILYVGGFMLVPGQSLTTALSGGMMPAWTPLLQDGMCEMQNPKWRFYNDLPDAEAARWAARLRRCPAMVQLTPLENAAYFHVPSTYLFCERDRAIPLPVQQWMVDNVRAFGAEFDTMTCDASHVPFLAQQDLVEGYILKLARDRPVDYVQAHQKQAERFIEIVSGLAKMASEAQVDVAKELAGDVMLKVANEMVAQGQSDVASEPAVEKQVELTKAANLAGRLEVAKEVDAPSAA